jgi:hypothetical protein
VPGGPARIAGDVRVGATLEKRAYVLKTVGRGATYTPAAPGLLACDALGTGPGGATPVPPATVRVTAAG